MYLDENQEDQEERLISVLHKYKGDLGWNIMDIKGIDHHIYTHRTTW